MASPLVITLSASQRYTGFKCRRMRIETWRVRTTGTAAARAARPATQPSTELWVWTMLTRSRRIRRLSAQTAPRSQAPRMRTPTTSKPAARARSTKRPSG